MDVFTDVDTPDGSDAEGEPEEVQITITSVSKLDKIRKMFFRREKGAVEAV